MEILRAAVPCSWWKCFSFVLKQQNGSEQIFSWRLRADSPAPGEEPGFLPRQQECLVLPYLHFSVSPTPPCQCMLTVEGLTLTEEGLLNNWAQEKACTSLEGGKPSSTGLKTSAADCDTQPSPQGLWLLRCAALGAAGEEGVEDSSP